MSLLSVLFFFFFFSSRRRHTRSLRDWSSDVCSSDLEHAAGARDFGVDRGIGVVRAVAEVTGQRVERSLDRRIQAASAAGGGSRMSGLVADGVNGRRGEAFEARIVDERRGQHEAAV